MKLAIVGNVIDFGTTTRFNLDDMIKQAIHAHFDDQGYSHFKKQITKATTIAYLADNTGEIFFDKLLLEQIYDTNKNIVFVVKMHPIINDATKNDAHFANIQKYATILEGDKGSSLSAPGMVLSNVSNEFHDLLKTADVIISKGQGNYEALSDLNREIFFLLMIKCPLVSDDIKQDLGKMVLKVKG